MCFICALLSCLVDPSWSFSLRAFYSAPGPFGLQALHSAFRLHHHGSLAIIMFKCACVVLTSRASTYSASGPAHFPSYPIGIVLAPFGFRNSWQCIQTIRFFSSAW